MDATWAEHVVRLLVVLIIVAANGFFVAAEFSLVGVRRTRIDTLARSGSASARRLQGVLGSLDAYISATQLGITLASLSLGWIGEETIAHLLKPLFDAVMPATAATIASESIAIGCAFLIITVLHIVLGELAPKTLALERTEAVALAVALPMRIFYRVFRWPIWLLNKAGNIVVRLAGLSATAEHAAVYTEDELRHLIDISHHSGHLNRGERELINNVFEFADETVRDCMVPRTEVVAARADLDSASLVALFRECKFSRLPVFEGTLDSITGVVYARDVLGAALDGREVTARDLARPALFVPLNAQLDYVLTRMKQSGYHMSAVVDEHGGFVGIVTLEDLLEEIVGEIRDEFDEGLADQVVEQPDGSLLVQASMPVRVLNRRLGLDLPESGQYATLAGYLLARTGAIPRQGTDVSAGGHIFTIENIRRNRILTVRLRLGMAGGARGEVGDV